MFVSNRMEKTDYFKARREYDNLVREIIFVGKKDEDGKPIPVPIKSHEFSRLWELIKVNDRYIDIFYKHYLKTPGSKINKDLEVLYSGKRVGVFKKIYHIIKAWYNMDPTIDYYIEVCDKYYYRDGNHKTTEGNL